MDTAYDSSDIYDYIFENTHAMPVIDTNRRRGIVENKLSYNRKLGIVLGKKESSRYKLRWEIERTFSILRKYWEWSISGILNTGIMMYQLEK